MTNLRPAQIWFKSSHPDQRLTKIKTRTKWSKQTTTEPTLSSPRNQTAQSMETSQCLSMSTGWNMTSQRSIKRPYASLSLLSQPRAYPHSGKSSSRRARSWQRRGSCSLSQRSKLRLTRLDSEKTMPRPMPCLLRSSQGWTELLRARLSTLTCCKRPTWGTSLRRPRSKSVRKFSRRTVKSGSKSIWKGLWSLRKERKGCRT